MSQSQMGPERRGPIPVSSGPFCCRNTSEGGRCKRRQEPFAREPPRRGGLDPGLGPRRAPGRRRQGPAGTPAGGPPGAPLTAPRLGYSRLALSASNLALTTKAWAGVGDRRGVKGPDPVGTPQAPLTLRRELGDSAEAPTARWGPSRRGAGVERAGLRSSRGLGLHGARLGGGVRLGGSPPSSSNPSRQPLTTFFGGCTLRRIGPSIRWLAEG